MGKKELETKYRSQRVAIICLSIAVFGLAMLSLTLLQSNQRHAGSESGLHTVNATLTEKINRYLTDTRKLLSGKNYCASQVLGYDDTVAYARFSCSNDSEQGLGDTAKFTLKDGAITGIELADEANYGVNIKKLLPSDVYEAHSYYMTHYGTADLNAITKMQMNPS